MDNLRLRPDLQVGKLMRLFTEADNKGALVRKSDQRLKLAYPSVLAVLALAVAAVPANAGGMYYYGGNVVLDTSHALAGSTIEVLTAPHFVLDGNTLSLEFSLSCISGPCAGTSLLDGSFGYVDINFQFQTGAPSITDVSLSGWSNDPHASGGISVTYPGTLPDGSVMTMPDGSIFHITGTKGWGTMVDGSGNILNQFAPMYFAGNSTINATFEIDSWSFGTLDVLDPIDFTAETPEPASGFLLGGGLAFAAFLGRRRILRQPLWQSTRRGRSSGL